eukprot:scaffold6499_cov19-Tisochrysis_lutea.AAC.3
MLSTVIQLIRLKFHRCAADLLGKQARRASYDSLESISSTAAGTDGWKGSAVCAAFRDGGGDARW